MSTPCFFVEHKLPTLTWGKRPRSEWPLLEILLRSASNLARACKMGLETGKGVQRPIGVLTSLNHLNTASSTTGYLHLREFWLNVSLFYLLDGELLISNQRIKGVGGIRLETGKKVNPETVIIFWKKTPMDPAWCADFKNHKINVIWISQSIEKNILRARLLNFSRNLHRLSSLACSI